MLAVFSINTTGTHHFLYNSGMKKWFLTGKHQQSSILQGLEEGMSCPKKFTAYFRESQHVSDRIYEAMQAWDHFLCVIFSFTYLSIAPI